MKNLLRRLRVAFTTRAWRAGAYSVFAAVIVIAMAAVANLAVSALPSSVTQLDLTANKLYSISSDPESSWAAFARLGLIFGVILWRLTQNGPFALAFTGVLEGVLAVCYALVPGRFGGLFAQVVRQAAVFDRFDIFTYDIFDIRSLVYYITVSAVFLFLTVQSMERRRWAA